MLTNKTTHSDQLSFYNKVPEYASMGMTLQQIIILIAGLGAIAVGIALMTQWGKGGESTINHVFNLPVLFLLKK